MRFPLFSNQSVNTDCCHTIVEENLITYFGYDEIYSSILLGTSGGTVLRLFYQKEKHSKKNHLVEESDEPKSGAPLKLVWCLEVSSLFDAIYDLIYSNYSL